jgi:hypothetical protein
MLRLGLLLVLSGLGEGELQGPRLDLFEGGALRQPLAGNSSESSYEAAPRRPPSNGRGGCRWMAALLAMPCSTGGIGIPPALGLHVPGRRKSGSAMYACTLTGRAPPTRGGTGDQSRWPRARPAPCVFYDKGVDRREGEARREGGHGEADSDQQWRREGDFIGKV